jgi:peptidyl-prolyl cis-trans isomerase SurA
MRANRMRSFWAILLTAVLIGPAFGEPQLFNGVAVIVNEAIITYQEVELYVGAATQELERNFGNQPQVLRQRMAELRSDGTEQLVERQLILHEFKTAGYNFPESYIDETIRDRIKQRYGDRVTLARTLKAQGVSFETYRQRTREEIIIEMMRHTRVSKEIIISPQKIRDAYETSKTNFALADQVKLRMIVLNKPVGGDNGATKKLAGEILGKIETGASFEEMARIHSEGSQRTVGGDWGWVERSVLRKELAEAAFALKKGAHSGVIELPTACFIMLVEDTRSSHVKPLSEVTEEVEKSLMMKERARLQKNWTERLKTKSFVRYF